MTKIPVITPMSVSTLRLDQFRLEICIPSRLSVCTAPLHISRAQLQCWCDAFDPQEFSCSNQVRSR